MTSQEPAKRLRIFDWSPLVRKVFVLSLFSIPLFSGYFILLYNLCSLVQGLLSSILSISIQIVFGLFVSRKSYFLGRELKRSVEFVDTSELGNGWTTTTKQIHLGTIQNIFDDFARLMERITPKNVDDLIDVLWFFVLVWATMSTGLSVALEFNGLVCGMGSPVLLSISILGILAGYRSTFPLVSLDDLAHLEHKVTSRISLLEDVFKKHERTILLKSKEKGKNQSVDDFGISARFDTESGSITSFEYWIGLSSQSKERIILSFASLTKPPQIIELQCSDFVKTGSWRLEVEYNKSVTKVLLFNIESSLDMTDVDTFVTGPSVLTIEENHLQNSVLAFLKIVGV